jgi:hypothetical protein
MVSNRARRRRSTPAMPAFTRLYTGFALSVVTIVTEPIVAAIPAQAQAVGACAPISWSDPPATLPSDVCGPTAATDATTAFAALSWQLFKYLVWPAWNERGKPDLTMKITDKAAPRTFETFKGDWETFLPNAEKPAAWNDYPAVAAPCKNHPALQRGDLVLASFTKFGNLDEVSGRGRANLLIAQNKTYVRYLTAYNETVFRKIRDNELYNSAVVGGVGSPLPKTPTPDEKLPPIPDLTNQDDGAMTIKSAWIELPDKGPSPIDASRFYVRQAWIQDPDKIQDPNKKEGQNCRRARVGLVGLHIVYKTKLRPQWIWATFEHVDNVPPFDNVPPPNPQPGQKFTFNDGSGHPMTGDPEDDYKIPPPTGSNGPGDPPRPFQVERLQKIRTAVMSENKTQQSALRNLDSRWQYYGLVMTQWPTVPGEPLRLPAPEPLGSMKRGPAVTNTTMETFLQTQPDNPVPEWTCMGCHATARMTDFVFSIMINRQKPAGTTSVPAARAEAIKQLQDILQKAVAK